MKKILSKFIELYDKGKTFEEISENIFLNYSAIKDNDLIYEMKKKISKEFSVDLIHVHLIGSSHTGFSKNFIEKDGKDYDFCIIDHFIFEKFLLKVKIENINQKNKDKFYKNLCIGKLHYYYVDNELKQELKDKLEQIRIELNTNKEISVCFYISEKAFVKVISKFLEKKWLESKTTGRSTIEPLERLEERKI